MTRLTASVRQELAIELSNRQGWKCFWCGEQMSRNPASIHYRTLEHVIPNSTGREGIEDKLNLRAACRQCNEIRGQFNNGAELQRRVYLLLERTEQYQKTIARQKVTMAGRCIICKFRFLFSEWRWRRKQQGEMGTTK